MRVALLVLSVLMLPAMAAASAAPQPSGESLVVFELHHVGVKEAMTIVRSIASPTRVAADERTNQVFVYGDALAVELARQGIAALDRPLPEAEIEVQFRCFESAPRIEDGAIGRLETAGTPCGGGRAQAVSGEIVTFHAKTPYGTATVRLQPRTTGQRTVVEWELGAVEARPITDLVGSWPGPPRVAVVELGGATPGWVAAIVRAAPSVVSAAR
jgi:hypothetical protein